ncbi:hypothetical protein FBZ96_11965 [Bradyrhizobium stylosanthis]|uniref:Uncharacterized protein n=1 Tax=Bradyrhizobium stylosanthis TaxID=1803665 RepID=A0A560CXL5_9BRAD|nr:hypothetical protein FBZ96_11965 [Bradyrhizobium stylosanthis]
MTTTGYEQPGDPSFEGGAAYERYCEEQERHRNEIIERCARAAELASLPAYGTHARHTGREEARKKIAATIRAMKTGDENESR